MSDQEPQPASSPVTGVTVQRIDIYPLKSFPGVPLETARLLPSGPLENDRRWALFDASGRLLNAKRSAQLQRLGLSFSADLRFVTVSSSQPEFEHSAADEERLEWPGQIPEVERWLSDRLRERVKIRENATAGFPDDAVASGPTIIGSATLQAIQARFPQLTIDEIRRRFRANLTLATAVPFWEDRLFGPPGKPRPFAIGAVEFLGINPCQRCAVPARDSLTGEVTPGFQKEFTEWRKSVLPEGIEREHFNHYYRLAVNTRLARAEAGLQLSEGDPLHGQ